MKNQSLEDFLLERTDADLWSELKAYLKAMGRGVKESSGEEDTPENNQIMARSYLELIDPSFEFRPKLGSDETLQACRIRIIMGFLALEAVGQLDNSLQDLISMTKQIILDNEKKEDSNL